MLHCIQFHRKMIKDIEDKAHLKKIMENILNFVFSVISTQGFYLVSVEQQLGL